MIFHGAAGVHYKQVVALAGLTVKQNEYSVFDNMKCEQIVWTILQVP